MKTIKKSMILALILLVGMPMNIMAAAEKTATSDATVEIVTETPTDSVTPINPNNPTIVRPATPDYATNNPATNQVGGLTIDTVPNFTFRKYVNSDFENPKAGTGSNTLYSIFQSTTADTGYTQYVQVSDRTATGNGWRLDVKAGDLVAYGDNGTTPLANAPAIPFVMNLKSTTLNPIARKDFTLGMGLEIAPTTATNNTYTFTSGTQTSATLMTAATGFGMGTWALRFEGGPSGSSLVLNTDLARANGTTDITTYKSIVTWDLYSTPTGS